MNSRPGPQTRKARNRRAARRTAAKGPKKPRRTHANDASALVEAEGAGATATLRVAARRMFTATSSSSAAPSSSASPSLRANSSAGTGAPAKGASQDGAVAPHSSRSNTTATDTRVPSAASSAGSAAGAGSSQELDPGAKKASTTTGAARGNLLDRASRTGADASRTATAVPDAAAAPRELPGRRIRICDELRCSGRHVPLDLRTAGCRGHGRCQDRACGVCAVKGVPEPRRTCQPSGPGKPLRRVPPRQPPGRARRCPARSRRITPFPGEARDPLRPALARNPRSHRSAHRRRPVQRARARQAPLRMPPARAQVRALRAPATAVAVATLRRATVGELRPTRAGPPTSVPTV